MRGDLLEIVLMWRCVYLKGKILFLRVVDGIEEEVLFEDCKVVVVLSSLEFSWKWYLFLCYIFIYGLFIFF